MPTVHAQIEIAASPADVRKAFLDFDSYPEWSKDFIKSVEVTSGDKADIQAGDKLAVVLTGMSFTSTVATNTPEEFKWYGSIPFLFSGEHAFHFTPSTTTPGHTRLVQKEDFSGLLSFLVGPEWSEGKKTKANFEKFNGELKRRVEAYGT